VGPNVSRGKKKTQSKTGVELGPRFWAVSRGIVHMSKTKRKPKISVRFTGLNLGKQLAGCIKNSGEMGTCLGVKTKADRGRKTGSGAGEIQVLWETHQGWKSFLEKKQQHPELQFGGKVPNIEETTRQGPLI